MEPEICTKMLKKMREKLRVQFLTATPSCSMVKTGPLDDSFLKVFKPQASPVKGQSLQQKEKKRRKREGKKMKNQKA